MQDERRWGIIGVIVFLIAGFLLVSFGGAIVAAPATVPLMLVSAARHPTRAFRAAAVLLSSLTLAEVAWALTYGTLGEGRPWIWLIPCLTAVACAAASTALLRPRGPRDAPLHARI